MHSMGRFLLAGLAGLVLVAAAAPAAAQTARQDYERALAREKALAGRKTPPATQVRAVVTAYERVVRKYPRSGYSDNALWQGAGLSLALFERTGVETDRRKAIWMLDLLVSQYPSSSLVSQARQRLTAVERTRVASARPTAPSKPTRRAAPADSKGQTAASSSSPVAPPPAAPVPARPADDASTTRSAASPASLISIREIRRIVLPD